MFLHINALWNVRLILVIFSVIARHCLPKKMRTRRFWSVFQFAYCYRSAFEQSYRRVIGLRTVSFSCRLVAVFQNVTRETGFFFLISFPAYSERSNETFAGKNRKRSNRDENEWMPDITVVGKKWSDEASSESGMCKRAVEKRAGNVWRISASESRRKRKWNSSRVYGERRERRSKRRKVYRRGPYRIPWLPLGNGGQLPFVVDTSRSWWTAPVCGGFRAPGKHSSAPDLTASESNPVVSFQTNTTVFRTTERSDFRRRFLARKKP